MDAHLALGCTIRLTVDFRICRRYTLLMVGGELQGQCFNGLFNPVVECQLGGLEVHLRVWWVHSWKLSGHLAKDEHARFITRNVSSVP